MPSGKNTFTTACWALKCYNLSTFLQVISTKFLCISYRSKRHSIESFLFYKLLPRSRRTTNLIFAYTLEKKVIEFKSVEWLRGYSFEDGVFVLCEEAQGFDTDLMQMMTTRVGDGAQLCLTGDWRQKDIRKETGLLYLSQLLEAIKTNPPKFLDKEDIYELENNIGFVNFTFEDSGRRSKLTKALVKAFYFEKEKFND